MTFVRVGGSGGRRGAEWKHESPAGAGLSKGMADNGLLSHLLAEAVPSALRGLTTVFGMGTGVAPAR